MWTALTAVARSVHKKPEGKYFPLQTEQTRLIKKFIIRLLIPTFVTSMFLYPSSILHKIIIEKIWLGRKQYINLLKNILESALIVCCRIISAIFPSKHANLYGKCIERISQAITGCHSDFGLVNELSNIINVLNEYFLDSRALRMPFSHGTRTGQGLQAF